MVVCKALEELHGNQAFFVRLIILGVKGLWPATAECKSLWDDGELTCWFRRLRLQPWRPVEH